MSSANFGLMYFTNHNPQNFYYVGAIYKIVFDKNMRVSTLVFSTVQIIHGQRGGRGGYIPRVKKIFWLST